MSNIVRDDKGRYVDGSSGNPDGNPNGAERKRVGTLAQMLRERIDAAEFAERFAFALQTGCIPLLVVDHGGRPRLDINGNPEFVLSDRMSPLVWLRFAEYYRDTTEGRPMQRMDVTSDGKAMQYYAAAPNGDQFSPDEWPDD